MNSDRWTNQETAYLTQNWGKVHAIKIAARLNRSLTACYKRAQALGLKSKLTGRFLKGENYKGSDFYKTILTEYATMSYGQLAHKHNVPKTTAKNWIHRAKLYRDRGKLTNSTRP